MPMYDLIEYSGNCSMTSGSLWNYCRVNNDANESSIMLLVIRYITTKHWNKINREHAKQYIRCKSCCSIKIFV